MTVETDHDVVGDEAIMHDGKCIGHVTSGGYAHHVKASVAMGYVNSALAANGTKLAVEINGAMCPAVVRNAPLHDPTGERMRVSFK